MYANQLLFLKVRQSNSLLEPLSLLYPLGLLVTLCCLNLVRKKESAFLSQSVLLVCLYLSHALVIPVLRFTFYFLNREQKYFIIFVMTIAHVSLYNYKYLLIKEHNTKNDFNINTSTICVNCITLVFIASLVYEKALLMFVIGNLYDN